MELPFLDITLRISDARIQTSVYYTHNYLNLTSFYPHHCKNILSLTASFSGCAAFTLMVMTPFCDQADWFTLYWPWLFPFLSHKLSTKGSNHYPSRYAAPQLKVKKHVGLLHWSLFYRAAVSVYDAKAAIKSVSSLRYEAVSVPFLSVSISPANPRILFTEYPTADGLFFRLVELDEALGVVLANISEAYAATL